MSSKVEHVLFLVADQWRGDVLGQLGTPGVQTPALDALAKEGVTFTNHWCQASPCGPSRSSMLLGTPVTTHGQWTNDHIADFSTPSLASCLKGSGIRPLLVGYTDTPTKDRATRSAADLYDPSFDVVRPFFWQVGFPEYRLWLKKLGYLLEEDRGAPYKPSGPPTLEGLAPSFIPSIHSDVTWLTDGAIQALDSCTSTPCLLHVNWLRPHPPLAPPEPFHRIVDPDDVALPTRGLTREAQFSLHPLYQQAGAHRQMAEYLQRRVLIDDIDERDEKIVRAAYYGHCAQVDYDIGRLINELKRKDLWDTTMVIFASDHGDALGDHWLYGRRGPDDGHFKVPCIIRDPRSSADVSRGKKVEAFTTNMDLMPTILQALDVLVPESVDGMSLNPFLTSEEPTQWREHVRYDMDWTDHAQGDRVERFSAIRTSDHCYVEFTNFEPLLFDLRNDPLKTVNLANEPLKLATVKDLASLLG